jgi:hypothetical protein
MTLVYTICGQHKKIKRVKYNNNKKNKKLHTGLNEKGNAKNPLLIPPLSTSFA